jgi:hypothetical protein
LTTQTRSGIAVIVWNNAALAIFETRASENRPRTRKALYAKPNASIVDTACTSDVKTVSIYSKKKISLAEKGKSRLEAYLFGILLQPEVQ